MRNPLSIIILILWFLLGLAYCNASNDCCNDNSNDIETAAISESSQEVVGDANSTDISGNNDESANNSSATGISADSLTKIRNSIISKLNSNQLLEITGLYSPDEVNNTEFENLGLSRANDIRKLYPDLPDEKFRLSSKMIDGYQFDSKNPFGGAEFNYRVNTDKIKEIDQKTLIYFPQNSKDKLNNEEVKSYQNNIITN